MDETFLLTNTAPQVGEFFNRHCKYIPKQQISVSLLHEHADWAFFEDFCRKLTNPFTNVFVFTVPLYRKLLLEVSRTSLNLGTQYQRRIR